MVALQDAQHTRSVRVLCDADGEPLTKKVVWGMMRRAALKAGTKRGVHILRHTFCSRLALQGAPTRAMQALAGHQDIRTTEPYMHLAPGATNAAVRLLERGGA